MSKKMTEADHNLILSIPKALAVTDRVCSSVNVGSTKTGLDTVSYTHLDVYKRQLEYAGIQMSPYVQLFGKLSQEKAWEESRQEMISYLCYCALVSLRAYKMLTEELKKRCV